MTIRVLARFLVLLVACRRAEPLRAVPQSGEAVSLPQEPACPTPLGEQISVRPYVPPSSAAGCRLDASPSESTTLNSESEFRAVFRCPLAATSGIDFARERLHIAVLAEAGVVAPQPLYAVLAQGVLQLGFDVANDSAEGYAATKSRMILLPSSGPPVEDEACRHDESTAVNQSM